MRWLCGILLQMSIAVSILDAAWDARWTILVAGFLGGLVFVAVGVWVLRHPAGRTQT